MPTIRCWTGLAHEDDQVDPEERPPASDEDDQGGVRIRRGRGGELFTITHLPHHAEWSSGGA